MKKFSERIRDLRTEKKVSQKMLAQQLNLSEHTISHYESGYSEPNLDTLIKIADYFDVSLDYLVGRSDNY